MTAPTLAGRLVNGDTLMCGWSALSDPLACEAIALSGYPAVCIDGQHGYAGYEAMKAGMLGVRAGDAAPLLRIPLGDFSLAARAFDLGFEAVIAPMINSADDASRLVEALKYPPVGERSWGPARPTHAFGIDKDDWLARGNDVQLVFAMIETEAAVTAVDAIAATPGIDGLFIGPSDMSISASAGALNDPEAVSVVAAMDAVATACKAHGVFGAGYAQSPAIADAYRARGFQVIACGSDYGFVRDGAAAALKRFGG